MSLDAQADTVIASSNVKPISSLASLAFDPRKVISKRMLDSTLPDDQCFEVADGMALSVWNNKYSRPKADGTKESWKERLYGVVYGNYLINSVMRDSDTFNCNEEGIEETWKLAQKGVIAFAGRHLQHGDEEQYLKNQERFTNCSTAITSFMMLKLGLDGSGIGSDYSSAVRRVNWDNAPYIRCVLSNNHPDFYSNSNEFSGNFHSLEEAREIFPSESEKVRWFDVEDSCEGWVRALATIETAAYHEKHADKTFIFNFTPIRCEGTPIAGQQGRPASGPLPLMRAFQKIAALRGAHMEPWKQAMFVDHYLASCIVLGGVRRMARMATKYWKDRDIFDFIEIKRTGQLWSANNSILVDQEFWDNIEDRRSHAFRVYNAAIGANWDDNTGEPGFINVDKIHQPTEAEKSRIDAKSFLNENYYNEPFHEKTYEMVTKIISATLKQPYTCIVNPCSEISLNTSGGYCLVADVVGSNTETKEEFVAGCRRTAEALIRVNKMNSMYKQETDRTNRIGVSQLGIHEMAWKHFGLTFYDMIENFDELMEIEDIQGYIYEDSNFKNLEWWKFIDSTRIATEEAARVYSMKHGMSVPATVTTLKPGGTVSKVVSTTESANLPAFRTYLRWVQFDITVPKIKAEVEDLQAKGYPVKDISKKYPGKWVVGYPTKLPIVDLMGHENVVTASEVSPEDHFKWLMLLEKFWLGTNKDGSPRNNQISYTLKYSREGMTVEDFSEMVKKYQSKIRCCSFNETTSADEMISVYGYVPEEEISEDEFNKVKGQIAIKAMKERYDNNDLQCSSGVCPIEADIYAEPVE